MNRLFSDGYIIDGERDRFDDLSVITLRSALKAYFSTYSSIRRSYSQVFTNTGFDEGEIYSVDFYENYLESVIHFHHFFELMIKSVLREISEILVVFDANSHSELFDLIAGNAGNIDAANIKTVEFSVALSRLCKLVTDNKIVGNPLATLISANRPLLEQLNGLRNRLLHRGRWIIKYSSLDKIVALHILPLMNQIIQAEPALQNQLRFWKYGRLNCGLDPLGEIGGLLEADPVFSKKLAHLKELARAAYQNPLQDFGNMFPFRNRDHRIAKNFAETYEPYAIATCPVCGHDSLLLFESGGDTDIDANGQPIQYPTYVDEVHCIECTYMVQRDIENLSIYFPSAPGNNWF